MFFCLFGSKFILVLFYLNKFQTVIAFLDERDDFLDLIFSHIWNDTVELAFQDFIESLPNLGEAFQHSLVFSLQEFSQLLHCGIGNVVIEHILKLFRKLLSGVLLFVLGSEECFGLVEVSSIWFCVHDLLSIISEASYKSFIYRKLFWRILITLFVILFVNYTIKLN
jgi:hypothetical protein